jgi:hypothetical protein
LKSAGFDYLCDVLGHTLADSRQFEFFEIFAFLEELNDRPGETFDGPGGVSVSQDAEQILALNLQQVRVLAQYMADLYIFH